MNIKTSKKILKQLKKMNKRFDKIETDIAEFKKEIKTDIADFKTDFKTEISKLNKQVSYLAKIYEKDEILNKKTIIKV